jgi:hypothetical protein
MSTPIAYRPAELVRQLIQAGRRGGAAAAHQLVGHIALDQDPAAAVGHLGRVAGSARALVDELVARSPDPAAEVADLATSAAAAADVVAHLTGRSFEQVLDLLLGTQPAPPGVDPDLGL